MSDMYAHRPCALSQTPCIIVTTIMCTFCNKFHSIVGFSCGQICLQKCDTQACDNFCKVSACVQDGTCNI